MESIECYLVHIAQDLRSSGGYLLESCAGDIYKTRTTKTDTRTKVVATALKLRRAVSVKEAHDDVSFADQVSWMILYVRHMPGKPCFWTEEAIRVVYGGTIVHRSKAMLREEGEVHVRVR